MIRPGGTGASARSRSSRRSNTRGGWGSPTRISGTTWPAARAWHTSPDSARAKSRASMERGTTRCRSTEVWYLPIDRAPAELAEVRVDFGEGPAAEKAAARRKRRRVRRLDDRVPAKIDQLRLLARVRTPEHEDDRLGARIQRPDRRIGERLPALALVRVGLVRAYCQNGVQQQHSPLGPRREAAVV